MSSFFNRFRKSKKTDSTPSVATQIITPNGLEKQAKDAVISETALDESTADLSPTWVSQSPPSAMEDRPLYEVGDLIAGQFQVTDRLEGSMAYVYLTYDKSQDISYAIKQPKQTILADPAFSSRILQAVDAWTNLGLHPHIAYCYSFREIEDVPHIFVEQVDGSNLREWIDTDKYEDLRLRLDLAIQVCHGMERAHERDLIHGDLRPENILISLDDKVRITDFGLKGEGLHYRNNESISHPSDSGISLDVMLGTPAYMSPEQLLDPKQRTDNAPQGVWYDSDIFSFGVCLWEMTLDHLPYNMAPSVSETPDPQDYRKDIPQSLTSLLTDVIAIDRSERPQEFKALRESLNDIYQELYGNHAPSYTLEPPKEYAAHELNNRGYAFLELKDISRARSSFYKAIETSPTHPQSIYNLSLIQWRCGEITDTKVLSRLESCINDPDVDRRIVDDLMAEVQAERYNLNAAKTLLEDYPGRYEALFGGMDDRQALCSHTLVGHRGWINSVALVSDGSRGLSGSDDKTVRLWNLDSGDCLHKLEGHKERVNAVALTPDGHWGLSGSDDGTVRFWDLNRGKSLQVFRWHKSEVTSVALSADGSLALSGSNDKTLALWYTKTGECVHILSGHTGRVRSVDLTPDGNIGLSGSNDKTLRFWDLRTGQCIRTTEESLSWIQSVTLTKDGKRGLSGNRDGSLCLWNQENEAYRRKFVGHSMPIEAVALTADARWALSASRRDTTLRLWELKTGQSIQIMMGQQSHLLSLAITPDGTRILIGNHEKTVQLWELPLYNRYRAAYRIAPHRRLIKQDITAVAYQQQTMENDKIKGTGVVDQEHAPEFEEKQEMKVADEKSAKSPGDTSDNLRKNDAWIALRETWNKQEFTEDIIIVQKYRRLLEEWQATTLLKVKTVHRMEGDNNGFYAVSQSGDGRWGLSGNGDASLSFWNLETGKNLRTLEGHTAIVSAVAMTSNGRFGLSASADATLRYWDLKTGECLQILGETTDPFISVAMSPDGHWALTGQRLGFVDKSRLLTFWDLTTGKLVHSWEGHREQVRSVALSSDSRWALSGGADNTLRLWSLNTLANVHVLKGHTDVVNSVAMTPNCRWGLSGSQDTTLRFWNLQAGSCLRELKGHSAPVRSVALTANGHWGFSGDLHGSLMLWNLLTGECVETLEWHDGYITSVALTSDGCLGLSASVDNALVRWRFIWDLE